MGRVRFEQIPDNEARSLAAHSAYPEAASVGYTRPDVARAA